MKIDQSKITRTGNLFSEAEGINLPDCHRFKAEAEKIVAMLLRIPQPILDDLDEGGTGKLQVRVMVEYWRHYDALDAVLAQPMTGSRFIAFREWLADKQTTPPENIRRACQWLVETKTPVKVKDPFLQKLAELMDECDKNQPGGCENCPRNQRCDRWWEARSNDANRGQLIMTQEMFRIHKKEFEEQIKPR